MEQRWSTRTRARLEIDLSCQGMANKRCYTRDIGLGGVFLELGQNAAPPRDSIVELVFNFDHGTVTGSHRIRGKVVRVVEDGVGLMFRDFDANAFRSLRELINYCQSNTVDDTMH